MFVLTSYVHDKTGDPGALINIGADTVAGLNDCRVKTRTYARDTDCKEPENTRSNPADRIKRFVEGVSWQSQEAKEKVICSPLFAESARFLARCVLAVVYGEKITVKTESIEELCKDTSFRGRRYFIESIAKALETPGKIGFIRSRDNALIGLLSKNGPVPSVSNVFEPEGLVLNGKTAEEIIKSLDVRDKRIFSYWLNNKNLSDSKLYEYLKDIFTQLKITEDDSYSGTFAIKEELSPFPSFKENDIDIFESKIFMLPLIDPKYPLGGFADFKLFFNLKDGNDEIPYVFLPPLSKDAISAVQADGGKLLIDSLKLESPQLEKNRLVQISVVCTLKNNGFEMSVQKTYQGDQIRYLSAGIPSLNLYGVVPEYGWLTRRDIAFDLPYPVPLAAEDSGEKIDVKNIEFDGLKEPFTDTGDGFSVYCGHIPEWLSVSHKGGALGALPLRAVSGEKYVWQDIKTPNYLSRPIGQKKMIVAADIGSSRSAFVFQIESTTSTSDVLIEENQILAAPLSSFGREEMDTNFGVMHFLPRHQNKKVAGKIPVGILPTTISSKDTQNTAALFTSGKVFLLDAKNIQEADKKSRKILSDIKAGNNAAAMKLLAEGLITMIIDRAVREECGEIEIRLSYLPEKYAPLRAAFKSAIERCKETAPGVKIFDDDDTLMYLPESLSIANNLKSGNDSDFQASSGAVLVDIGDFTTDFALFLSEITDGKNNLNLKGNTSVQFAGRQIILQPVWDYLRFSGAKIETIFNAAPEVSEVIEHLRGQVEKNKNTKSDGVPEDVRRDILCLIPHFKKDALPDPLRNLIDICYLTIVIMIKRLVVDFPKGQGGEFKILLFGGGSSFFPSAESEAFQWNKVIKGRRCGVSKKSEDGVALANGLLKDVHKQLENAALTARNKGKATMTGAVKEEALIMPDYNELKSAYIQFLKNAQALKTWEVFDANNNHVSPGDLFNVHKPEKEKDGVIKNEDLYAQFFDGAVSYAQESAAGDIEVAKVLFAYKIAYQTAVAFYSRGR